MINKNPVLLTYVLILFVGITGWVMGMTVWSVCELARHTTISNLVHLVMIYIVTLCSGLVTRCLFHYRLEH